MYKSCHYLDYVRVRILPREEIGTLLVELSRNDNRPLWSLPSPTIFQWFTVVPTDTDEWRPHYAWNNKATDTGFRVCVTVNIISLLFILVQVVIDTVKNQYKPISFGATHSTPLNGVLTLCRKMIQRFLHTHVTALRMTWGRCTNVSGSKGAPALPPPYTPSSIIFASAKIFTSHTHYWNLLKVHCDLNHLFVTALYQ